MNNKQNIAILIIGTLVLIAGASWAVMGSGSTASGPTDGRYIELAQCISDSGAQFYGAFWCQHCNDQKVSFGDAAEYLPYVECSTASGQQTAECATVGIQSYPTWVFASGQSVSGSIALQSLADVTGCTMPADA